jgi:predicted transcriptional regulator
MAVSYKKLWKLLIDRDLKKKDLMQMAGISNYTLARLNKGDNISTETVAKICKALNCGFDDIMEIIEKGEK